LAQVQHQFGTAQPLAFHDHAKDPDETQIDVGQPSHASVPLFRGYFVYFLFSRRFDGG
jgi:hypothetical protein